MLVKLRSTNLLALARKAAAESQREAAKAVGISHGHWADIEGGRRQPSLLIGRKIAEHFGLDLDALFNEIPLEYGEPAKGKASA